jgi:hypothetical protein
MAELLFAAGVARNRAIVKIYRRLRKGEVRGEGFGRLKEDFGSKKLVGK